MTNEQQVGRTKQTDNTGREIVLHLLLGGMGFGKTTITRHLRERGFTSVFDSDECKTSETEGGMRALRSSIIRKYPNGVPEDVRPNPWDEHSRMWFAMIWAGVAISTRSSGAQHLLVADHGGHFCQHLTGAVPSMFGPPRVQPHTPGFRLGWVFGLTIPLNVAKERVRKRAGSDWDEEMALMTASSHASVHKAVKFYAENWSKGYVPLRAEQSTGFVVSEIGRRIFTNVPK